MFFHRELITPRLTTSPCPYCSIQVFALSQCPKLPARMHSSEKTHRVIGIMTRRRMTKEYPERYKD